MILSLIAFSTPLPAAWQTLKELALKKRCSFKNITLPSGDHFGRLITWDNRILIDCASSASEARCGRQRCGRRRAFGEPSARRSVPSKIPYKTNFRDDPSDPAERHPGDRLLGETLEPVSPMCPKWWKQLKNCEQCSTVYEQRVDEKRLKCFTST